MKMTYDREVDILTIRLRDLAISESDEIGPAVIVDFDASGEVVGFEILDASIRVDCPDQVSLELRG